MAKAARAPLGRFIDVLPWPAAIIAKSGRVTQLNHAMEDLGVRLKEQSARDLWSLFPAYFEVLEGNPPWLTAQRVEAVRQSPDGPLRETIWIRLWDSGSCMIVLDITRLHELEAGYAQNARLASLGFLLASVSHEINSPLSAISSMIQILQSKRGVSNEVRQKGTTLIAENARRLLLITRKLTSFARVDDAAGERFSLDAVIDEAFLQLKHDSLGETVDLDHQRDPEAIVYGSEHQMQQVFFNLFLNAAQAMNGRGTISVVTDRANADVSITISDTGVGIPQPHMSRVFEPFFTTKPRGGGMGLGLAITNEIIHEHGGSITAKNNLFGGANFQVKLPLARPIRSR